MVRLFHGLRAVVMLALGVHLRLHHQFHGPPVDYLGLGAAAAASWAGVPGPGEPVLIAAAIFAAKHDLDIASVLVVAWLGATLGGMIGWAVGWKAGRAVLTARGPLRGVRRRAIARGEEAFGRHPVLAVTLTPSWVSGINHVRPPIYAVVNAASAAAWSLAIGLGAYYAGPVVVDAANDEGLVVTLVVGLLVLTTGVVEFRRRRRARAGT